MFSKWILDIFGLWRRDTWIIGNALNALEAYKAIKSERNLGLEIVGFISIDGCSNKENFIDGLPVLQ
jgi:undecaprenyl-phosphate galactose phosphotransferase